MHSNIGANVHSESGLRRIARGARDAADSGAAGAISADARVGKICNSPKKIPVPPQVGLSVAMSDVEASGAAMSAFASLTPTYEQVQNLPLQSYEQVQNLRFSRPMSR